MDMFSFAISEIQSSYGDTVTIAQKKKSIIKFGRNSSVGTSVATVQQFTGEEENESFATSNVIDKIVTNDSSYVGKVRVEGHTISNDKLYFIAQDVLLNGHTPASLSTPLARVGRIYLDSMDNLGALKTIYVYEDSAAPLGVPSEDSKIHIILDSVKGESQKGSTSLSNEDYWLITKFYGSATRKPPASSANVEISLESRLYGFPWRNILTVLLSTAASSSFQVDAPPIFVIPKNSDVRIRAISSSSGTDVIAGVSGYAAAVN